MHLQRARHGLVWHRSRPVLAPCRALVPKDVTLPNGLTIRCTSTADEALFLYREHAVERVYLQQGISLRPGDTVVDVGANAALFAMVAAEACGPTGRVVCFEPIPEVAAACRENLARHASWCAARGIGVAPSQVVEAAVGDGSRREAEFTVYPRASGWSTMAPDNDETLANMGAYIEARLAAVRRAAAGGKEDAAVAAAAAGGAAESGSGSSSAGGSPGGLEEQPVGALERILLPIAAGLQSLPWARGVLRTAVRGYIQAVMLSGAQRVRCRVVSLREALQELGIDRVSLLKVDCERSELDVLRGIGGPDCWRRIDQIAMEVHGIANGPMHGDLGPHGSSGSSNGAIQAEEGATGENSGGGALGKVRALLAGTGGFDRVVVDQDAALAGTTLYNVYAMREKQLSR